jgi:O-antigen/teichoic acid export membrane protein
MSTSQKADEKSSTAIQSETKAMAFAGVFARVLNAGMVFLTQILFARTMGVTEFGIYATANTWMLLVSGIASLGLVAMPQRFLPEYELARDNPRIRGLIHFASFGPMAIGTGFCVGGALLAFLARDIISAPVATTTCIALLIVPALVSINVVEGIALAKAWKGLAYGINFVIRPLIAPLIFGGAWLSGLKPEANLAMAAMVIAAWFAALLLIFLVRRRFHSLLPSGPRIEERPRWIRAGLPVMLIDGAFMLMTSTDVILLSLFQTEAEVGTYSAAARLVALVAFIHYGLTWASGHHFSALFAAKNTSGLARFAARTTLWTFLPSLGAAGVIGLASPYLLLAFGSAFAGGSDITIILLLGLLARAAIGPAEQLLIMTDNQISCAHAYICAFLVNLAGCLVLAPVYGGKGAAVATALAYLTASLIIAWQVRRHLGFQVHILALLGSSDRKTIHV